MINNLIMLLRNLFFIVILLAFILSLPVSAMMPIWNITNNRETISDLAISNDGLLSIIGTSSGKVIVYKQNGTISWEKQIPGSLLVEYSENESAFIVGSKENIYSNKGVVRSFDENGTLLWYTNTGSVSALGIAKKNNRSVIGNRAGDLIVLDGDGEVVEKFNNFPQTDVVADISVSDNGKVFVYALFERYPQVRYVYIDTNKKGSIGGLYKGSRTGYGGGEQITALTLSSDGKYVLTSNGEGSHGILCLYGNGKMIWSKDMGEITAISLHPNGSYAYAGTANGDILGYSLSGNSSFVYPSGSTVTDLAFAVEKYILAAVNAEGNIYLFNQTGNLIWTYQIKEFPVAKISNIEIAQDGASLIVLVNDKSLYYFLDQPIISNITITEDITPPTNSAPTKSNQSNITIILGIFTLVLLLRRNMSQ